MDIPNKNIGIMHPTNIGSICKAQMISQRKGHKGIINDKHTCREEVDDKVVVNKITRVLLKSFEVVR